MLRIKPVSFDDLVSPLSQERIFLLLEVLDPVRCEDLNCALSIAGFLNVRIDRLPNDYESFIQSGFMSVELELSQSNRAWADEALDFFRRRDVRDAVKAYLFINEEFLGHSQDGHTSVHDILSDIQPPVNAAVTKG